MRMNEHQSINPSTPKRKRRAEKTREAQAKTEN
jgi:hypothetical protein